MKSTLNNAPRTDCNPVFIHSQLDDYGLSCSQFRVYCHLARRSNAGSRETGVAWPAVADMARVCRLHASTVRAALRTLLRLGLICSQLRPGRTTYYRLNRLANLIVDPLGAETPESESQGTPSKRNEGYPLQSKEAEGSPFEGDPRKVHTHGVINDSLYPVIQDIEQYANLKGWPMDAAKKFFLDKSSIGWVDRNGRPLKDWRPALEAYVASWKIVESHRPVYKPARATNKRGAFAPIAPATAFTSTEI
jgi:DNA-binding transcriptional ArsR family regulator